MKEIDSRLIDNEHLPLLTRLVSENVDLKVILNKITDELLITFSEYQNFIKSVKNRVSIYLVFHTIPVISISKKEGGQKDLEYYIKAGVLNILLALLWRFSDNIKDNQDPTKNSHKNFIYLLRIIKTFLDKNKIELYDTILESVEKSYLYDENKKPQIEDLINRYKLFLIVPNSVLNYNKTSLNNLIAYYNILTLSHDYLDLTKDIIQCNMTIPILLISNQYKEPIINTKNLLKLNEEIKAILEFEYLKIEEFQTELKILAKDVIKNT